eukprot:gene7289-11608_t
MEPKNEMTGDELDPSSKLKINIMVQTKYRLKNGFQYLEQSFKDFQTKFESIGFEFDIFAMSPKLRGNETKPNIDHPNFHFIEIDSKYLTKEHKKYKMAFPKTIRETRLVSQSLNFIQAMSTFYKTIGKPGEIFLYMEDDFTICGNSVIQLASIYLWSLRHRSEYKAIRIGFGHSGILMKYDLIPEMIQISLERSIQIIYPIDYAIAGWWAKQEGSDYGLYVFKYNIFHHIGSLSSVGNDGDHAFNKYKCFTGNFQHYNYYLEKFDTQNCDTFLISPCGKPNLQNELKYINGEAIEARSILKLEMRKFLMKKLGIDIQTSTEGIKTSCDKVCSSIHGECNESIYPLVNSCDILKKELGCTKCASLMWSVYIHSTPVALHENCIFSEISDAKCGQDSYDGKMRKLCVCKKK